MGILNARGRLDFQFFEHLSHGQFVVSGHGFQDATKKCKRMILGIGPGAASAKVAAHGVAHNFSQLLDGISLGGDGVAKSRGENLPVAIFVPVVDGVGKPGR